MKQRDVFQVIVRGFGMLLLLYGLESLFQGILYRIGETEPINPFLAKVEITRALLQFTLAGLFMRGAGGLVRFAFGETEKAEA